jgi:hypothetical protein
MKDGRPMFVPKFFFFGKASFEPGTSSIEFTIGVAQQCAFEFLASNNQQFDLQFETSTPEFTKRHIFTHCSIIGIKGNVVICVYSDRLPLISDSSKFRERIHTSEAQREISYMTLLNSPFLLQELRGGDGPRNPWLFCAFLITLLVISSRIMVSDWWQDSSRTESDLLERKEDFLVKFANPIVARFRFLIMLITCLTVCGFRHEIFGIVRNIIQTIHL